MSGTDAPAPSSNPEAGQPTPVQRRSMHALIMASVYGTPAGLAFTNSLLLLFLAKLGLGGAGLLVALALPSLVLPLLTLPLAHRADHRGWRREIIHGGIIATLGFAIIPAAAFVAGPGAWIALAGIVAFAVGQAQYNAPISSVIDAAVPRGMRGAFYGRLRFTWQFWGLAFGVACTFLLSKDSPIMAFEGILAAVVVMLALRVYYGARIEVSRPAPPGDASLLEAVLVALRAPGYAAFCCYVFLLTLATANAGTLLALVERDAMGFGDRAVVWMGNLLGLGSVLGYFVGGRLVDRTGTKPVFLVCHVGFGLTFAAILLREALPGPGWLLLGALNAAFGALAACSSIAISTEMLALAPSAHKSVSTGLCSSLFLAGGGLAGLLNAAAIRLDLLNPHWSLAGATFSAYDTLLLFDAVLVLLLVVTLGLVPSVMRKVE